MTPQVTAAAVLAAASGIDPRMPQPNDQVLAIWARILGDVDLTDALNAVAEHYSAAGVERLMPGDVLTRAKRMRSDRIDAIGPGMVPDADADDTAGQLAAVKAGRWRLSSEPTSRPRAVTELMQATARELPDDV